MARVSARPATALTVSPSKLNTFKRCPLDYFATYVDRTPKESLFNPVFARGSATHAVLAQAFEHFRRDGTFPINLDARIAAALPRDEYPDIGTWHYELDLIGSWVRWGLSQFDGTASVRAVERTFTYAHAGDGACPPFTLSARVDLVLEHPDGVIEHLDWKTGNSVWVDAIQTVAGRIVTGRAFPDRTIRGSTVCLGAKTLRSTMLERAQARETWTEIKDLVTAISSTTEWLPLANPLCEHCALYRAGCPVYPAEDHADQLTLWLDDAA